MEEKEDGWKNGNAFVRHAHVRFMDANEAMAEMKAGLTKGWEAGVKKW